jgi:hypothetical protein
MPALLSMGPIASSIRETPSRTASARVASKLVTQHRARWHACRRRIPLVSIASIQHHEGAVLGKPPGDRQPDALRRSRDERLPAGG